MTEAEVEIALERFGQVDGGLARRNEGSGLGLPLARKLAELHGGSLTLKSEMGRGTTATVILPPSRVPSAAPAAAGVTTVPASAGDFVADIEPTHTGLKEDQLTAMRREASGTL
jgi:histidine kinase/DNA gyrase B/HSP90-like ATPase